MQIKPALFSNDLMSTSDGLALVRVPFVSQIHYRERQVTSVLYISKQLHFIFQINFISYFKTTFTSLSTPYIFQINFLCREARFV